MTFVATALVPLLLSLPTQARAVELAAPLNDVPQCEPIENSQAPELSPEVTEARVGGYWWIRERGEHADVVSVPEAIQLLDGGGTPIEVDILPSAAFRISVPIDAAVGDTFLLRNTATAASVVLRVRGPGEAEAPLVVESAIASVAGIPEDRCFVDCFVEGQPLPRNAAVELTYSGGPGAVEIFFRDPRQPGFYTGTLLSRLIEYAPEPTTVTFAAGTEYFSGDDFPGGTAFVGVFALHDVEDVHSFEVEFETLPVVEFTNADGFFPRCDELGGGDRDDSSSFGGCASTPLATGADALLAGLLASGLALVSRRRRGFSSPIRRA